MASRRYARVNRAVCVACGTCGAVCPKGAAPVPDGRWAVVDAARCVGCGLCAKSCPAECIELAERTAEA